MMRLLMILLTIFFAITCQASSSNSLASLNEKDTINNLFIWINKAAVNQSLITPNALDAFFLPNVQYSVNGKLMANSTTELATRFTKLTKEFQLSQAVMPLDKVIFASNQAAISYRVKNITKNNKTYYDDVTVIITFENNKINKWQAIIAHEV